MYDPSEKGFHRLRTSSTGTFNSCQMFLLLRNLMKLQGNWVLTPSLMHVPAVLLPSNSTWGIPTSIIRPRIWIWAHCLRHCRLIYIPVLHILNWRDHLLHVHCQWGIQMLPGQDLHETSAKVHLYITDITPDCQANGHSRPRMLSPPCRTLTNIWHLYACKHHTAQVHLHRIFTPNKARCVESIDLGYASQRYGKQCLLGLLATSLALEKPLASSYSVVPYFKHICAVHIPFSFSAKLEVCQRVSKGMLQDLDEHLSPSV